MYYVRQKYFIQIWDSGGCDRLLSLDILRRAGGGGGVRMGVRSVCAQFPPYTIPEIVLEIG